MSGFFLFSSNHSYFPNLTLAVGFAGVLLAFKNFSLGGIQPSAPSVTVNGSAGETGRRAPLVPYLYFNLSVSGFPHLLSSAGLSSLMLYLHLPRCSPGLRLRCRANQDGPVISFSFSFPGSCSSFPPRCPQMSTLIKFIHVLFSSVVTSVTFQMASWQENLPFNRRKP